MLGHRTVVSKGLRRAREKQLRLLGKLVEEHLHVRKISGRECPSFDCFAQVCKRGQRALRVFEIRLSEIGDRLPAEVGNLLRPLENQKYFGGVDSHKREFVRHTKLL